MPGTREEIRITNRTATCMLNDAEISRDRNVMKKGAKRMLKFKDIVTEIQRMCNVKVKVIPVIIGAAGTISKSLRQCLSNRPAEQEMKELQRTAILGAVNCGKC
jgi:hypothetical protein